MATDHIEIIDKFDILRMKYKSKKIIKLPIFVKYEKHSKNDFVLFLIVIMFAVSTAYWARELSRHHLPTLLFLSAFLGLIVVGFFRKAISRWQVGAGTAVISAEGFCDSRLSDRTIAWSSCKSARIDKNLKTGNVRGVALALVDGVDAPKTSLAYRRAFLLPRKDDRCVYVELDGIKGAEDAAHAVQALILRHNQQA